MNQHLQNALSLIEHSDHLSAEEKAALVKVVMEADKELEITAFKLDRTEKVKRTTGILLEETISELEQKRKAVEAQNRELEIEAALERVRTVAMSMNKPDDMLEACKTISQQLELLNVKEIRNVQTAIFYVAKKTYTNFEYYAKHDKKLATETTYNNNEIHEAFATQMLKGAGEFFTTHIKDVNNWIAYQKTTNVFIDDYLYTASSLSYYWYSLGPVALGISTYAPLNEDELALFKRFRNVFELAYRRFMDIEQALAQAREAQIEAALERVRSRAMAMHKTDELLEAAELLYKELLALGMNSMNVSYAFVDEDEKSAAYYSVNPVDGKTIPFPFIFPHTETEVMRSLLASWKKQEPFNVIELDEAATLKHQTYIGEHVQQSIRNNNVDIDFSVEGFLEISPKKAVIYSFNFTHGYLFNIGSERLSEAQEQMLLRFTRVFDLTYRRFLDLQKAEAQAREALIELALERVRARTMAMQRSDELNLGAKLLFEQVKLLGIPVWSCGYNIWEKDEKVCTGWMSSENILQPSFKIPLTESASFIRFYESRQNEEEFYVEETSGEALADHYRYMQQLPVFGEILEHFKKAGFTVPASQVNHVVNFAHGNLIFITAQRMQGIMDIFRRFAKVFEQTYSRFLDLQKAEAQAREAQIELALERVRARTMAMQRSDELAEVATVLFQQVRTLGVRQWTCGFGIFEVGDKEFTWYPGSDEGEILPPVKIPLTEHPVFISFNESRKRGDELFVYEKEGEFQAGHYRYMQSLPGVGEMLQKMLDAGHSFPTFQIDHVANFSHGNLVFITYEPVPEMHDVFKRFAKVFEQTYTRFLDLQKAEAQSREAQIELGLERVRAKAMAMRKSEELSGLVATLFEELTKLNLVLYRCVIWIFNPDTLAARVWMANSEDKQNAASYFIQRLDHPYYEAIIQGWKDRASKWMYDLQGTEKKSIDQLLLTETELANLPGAVKEGILSSEHTIVSGSFNNFGLIEASGPVPETEEQLEILNRFGKVFDLTYTRFNDLKQAEAQAREAQIEAALERIRAKALAMQNSHNLIDVANVLREQMARLGQPEMESSIVQLYEEGQESFESWWAFNSPAGDVLTGVARVPVDSSEWSREVIDNYKKQGQSFTIESRGAKLKEWYQVLEKYVSETIEYDADGKIIVPEVLFYHFSKFSGGALYMVANQQPAEVSKELQLRAAAVFDLAYRRYKDLQRAESQARDAKIEAALERVRARTMAMHQSEELSQAAQVLFRQLNELGGIPDRISISIVDEVNNVVNLWITDQFGRHIDQGFRGRLNERTVIAKAHQAWKEKQQSLVIDLQGDELKEWLSFVRAEIGIVVKDEFIKNRRIHYFAFFTHGWIMATTHEPQAPESIQILEKFASVFNLTYRRFLDLQTAEMQAREATIEAAMEKVRGKAMGMHNSNDLSVTASLVFTELRKLGINPIRCGVGILNKESRQAQLYSATSSKDADTLSLVGWVLLSGHPVLENIYDSWIRGEEFYPELGGEELKSYYELLLAGLSVTIPDWQNGQKQYGTFLPFSVGCLYAWSENPYSDTEIKILKRFATIIDLTFRRYFELQKSEASAKEAIRRASLDRVRAEIASMRTIEDLQRITPLIWNELSILGIPFSRCGVFIMDEANEMIHTFLSTPEGEAIAAFHIPYQTPGNIGQVLQHWQERTAYINRWDETAFTEFAATLVTQGALDTPEAYLKTIPHGGIYLHFLPFLQGMLYVGNPDPLEKEEISLVQSVADAFSTAYARYEDFNKLESANTQIEHTLKELKQAQTQLIQSEKMASLGELTAGIAHEIQNPLNFVNNFSEINTELIEELEEEVRKGNFAEVHSIAKDIRDNEEKINHHGKRADAIVKGMLEHSRSSSGIKVPTDINKLADEYLRLAYHGLRAKDKSFNATLNTSYDESLGLLHIIPQDIGRVLLNLINNAFYAVAEKKKGSPRPLKGSESYEPIITVSTKAVKPPLGGLGATVLITIADNGNGIPQKILDKIFQPFFTTKPTGQGTGLGLSLAYDIIKSHGGELKVNTKEDDGSEFVIALPVNV